MNPNENQEADITPEADVQEPEVVSIPKSDYDKLNQTLGSLKREIKDLKKPKEEPKENFNNSKPEEFGLLQRTFLRSAGVTSEDEIELARKIQKETNMDWSTLPDSKYFKSELEDLRTTKANTNATANVRGGQGTSETKSTPEYWQAKGVPPTAQDIPDRKTRAKIVRSFMANSRTGGKKFYND